MAITNPPFRQLRLGETALRRPGLGPTGHARLILLAAGLALLMGWGILAPTDRHQREDAQSPSDTLQQPLFDGHGKWGGYMPQ